MLTDEQWTRLDLSVVPGTPLIFLHVPKTAGTSIRRNRLLRGRLNEHRRAVDVLAEVGEEAWRSRTWFSVVRNPWDRLVSHWHYMRGEGRKPPSPQRALSHRWYHRLRRWGDFPAFVERFDPRELPWQSQVYWLCEERDGKPRLLMDRLLRFGCLVEDWKSLLRSIGRSGPPLRQLNVGRHAPYTAHYTPRLRRIVAEKYADDIDFFGYTFENELPSRNCPLF